MRVLQEYYCPKCDKVAERFWDNKKDCPCKECETIMTRKISAAMTNGNSAHGMLQRKVF